MSEIIDTDQSFYRQSIWMVFATTTANIFAFGVNLVAPWMTMAEYGLMATLLHCSTLMMIPSMGLQAVFAVEGASAVSLKEDNELAQKAITGLFFTSLLWIVFAGLAFHFRVEIFRKLSISYPPAFWVTIFLGLPQLWLPILMGLLQGRQKFLGFGWALIANGVGRFSAVVFIIVILGGQAAGGMTGILLGTSAALAVCAWYTRSIWLRKFSGFKYRSWEGQILPLTLGLGAVQFMMSADMIFARSCFEPHQTGLYAIAGVFARGPVILTGPIVAVMFPKIVSSMKRAAPTMALSKALRFTVILAGAIATVCTIVAWLTPRLLALSTASKSPLTAAHQAALVQHSESLLLIARLIPWFVWSMMPLALANVLVAYMVARKFYLRIAGLAVIACPYALALGTFSGSMVMFIRLIGLFNLLFLLATVAAVYSKIQCYRTIFRIPFQLSDRTDMPGSSQRSDPTIIQQIQTSQSASYQIQFSPSPICPICGLRSATLIHKNLPGYIEETFFDIYDCHDCETRFTEPRDAQFEIYDSIYSTKEITGYERYFRYIPQVLEEKNPLRFLASQEAGYYALYGYLRNKSNLRILDVGCGYGYLTHALRQQGFEAYGFDVSGAAVKTAKESFGNFFHRSDIQEFAEKHSQTYDVVVALEVIEHLAEPVSYLEALLKLLAPNGILLVTTPNRDYYGKNAVWATELPPVHTIWLGKKGIFALARQAGCRIRMQPLANWYPKDENKLAKYIGCQWNTFRRPAMMGNRFNTRGIKKNRNAIRTAANRMLHKCGPIRMFCNIFHNYFLQIDETLAWFFWKKEDK